MRPENGVWAWGNSTARYVKEYVSNMKKYLVGFMVASIISYPGTLCITLTSMPDNFI